MTKAELDANFDWQRVARTFLTSRAVDNLEERVLYPDKKIVYQFSAKGHELGQVLLGSLLDHEHDAASAYYRSRPLLFTLGLSIEDAISGPLGKSGGFSDGRDIGVVCNIPSENGAVVLPMAGDVGSQYTPAAGWAEGIQYRYYVLGEQSCEKSIAVVLGGEGSVATNGFWSALTMATTLGLPLLFFIEDNGFAISVPSDKQTPGGNIANNLRSFTNLHIIEGDGTEPAEAARCIYEGVQFVRNGQTPALIRLEVPRLCGHSGQDTQAYKSAELLDEEAEQDPLPKLRQYLIPALFSEEQWEDLKKEIQEEVRQAMEAALSRPEPDTEKIKRFAFSESNSDGGIELQKIGGIYPSLHEFPPSYDRAEPEGPRINMLEGIRRTLEVELRTNPKLVLFGEDVGAKGGVHAATMGLQELFGEQRVFDTSLSEEGIIGRAVGMALAGLVPVPEIQFRKYADPATEQLNNCGTIRWRTCNAFAAPIIVRMAGGHSRRAGDPWHSVSGESVWLHQTGWQFVVPSNAEDAVGLLRTALRCNDPTMFFEHRALLDSSEARRPYPGDDFALPFGKAKMVQEGSELTLVSWGAMLGKSMAAAVESGKSVEILDLRTLSPWDREAVFSSVEKTKRCLIVHEDSLAVGFGAEIAAQLASDAFYFLDAPISRIAPPCIPIPYNQSLMNAVIPSVEQIKNEIERLVNF